MNYSVSVINKSGRQQSVAVFVADSSDNSGFSLVWWLHLINNNGNAKFEWDENDYGLGWGNTSDPIDIGVQFTSGQDPTPVFPNVVDGKNVLPISYNSAGFFSGEPYLDNKTFGKLEISTDSSFTVSNTLTMSVALYINKLPTIIMQGNPNMSYYFLIHKLSYYLVVTNFKQDTVLPTMGLLSSYSAFEGSMGQPVKIAFGPEVKNLTYTLDSTLNFTIN